MHKLLTRTSYIGEHRFNRVHGKTKVRKAAEETIVVPVPPIVDRPTFDAVQAQLQARNPKILPPRVVSGPTLLTGICFCGHCGGAMTIRTGKSGRYRYYTCSIRARQGETACPGRTIPMDTLDDLVVDHLKRRLLQPDRLREILEALIDQRRDVSDRRASHAAELRRKAAEADGRLMRLYDAIESGVAALDDPSLKERLAELKALRDQARVDADRAEALSGHEAPTITPAKLEAFAEAARRRLRAPEQGYRRAHLRALAQRVEVADREVRIMGSRGQLLRNLVAIGGGKSAAAGVPTSVPKWRTGWDSNPRWA